MPESDSTPVKKPKVKAVKSSPVKTAGAKKPVAKKTVPAAPKKKIKTKDIKKAKVAKLKPKKVKPKKKPVKVGTAKIKKKKKPVKKEEEKKEPEKRIIPDKYEPGSLKVNLYSTKGKIVREIPLPKVFDTEFRPDLIRRDVKASQANRRQRYGPAEMAGMRHAVSQWGKGRGTARVQRMTQENTAAESPPNVGGRRAHPPRPEHHWTLKINFKERRKARNTALATTAIPELVRKRGHKFSKKVTVPIVVEDNFAKIIRTKNVIRVLERLKVYDDVERARDGVHVRVGRGKMRGRRYKKPKSVLIIVPEFEGIERGASNLPGVEIVTPEHLNTELLAPGGDPGRLTIFTESAVKVIGAWENV
ncbi:MAG: 50S ribosomal protein L4 [Thermoplasmata archaeon]|nr:MAG: 50S ribosomal protein L4 [Thermoplasmata archaeon]